MRTFVALALLTAVVLAGVAEALDLREASGRTTAKAHQHSVSDAPNTCPPGAKNWCQQMGGLPE